MKNKVKAKLKVDKDFILFEEASALKELEFDEFCYAIHDYGYLIPRITVLNKPKFRNSTMNIGYISKTCTAPTYAQAFRWFRERYDLWGWITPIKTEGKERQHYFEIVNEGKVFTSPEFIGGMSLYMEDTEKEWNTYEEAELACLRKLIEIVKNKK